MTRRRLIVSLGFILLIWGAIVIFARLWDLRHPAGYVAVPLKNLVTPSAAADWEGRLVTVTGRVLNEPGDGARLYEASQTEPLDFARSLRLFVPPEVRVPSSVLESATFSGTLLRHGDHFEHYALQVEPPGFVHSTVLRRVLNVSLDIAILSVIGTATLLACRVIRLQLSRKLSSRPKARLLAGRLLRTAALCLRLGLLGAFLLSAILLGISYRSGWVWDVNVTKYNGSTSEHALISTEGCFGWAIRSTPRYTGPGVPWMPGRSSSFEKFSEPIGFLHPFRVSHSTIRDSDQSEESNLFLGLSVRTRIAQWHQRRATFEVVLIPYWMICFTSAGVAVPLFYRSWRKRRRTAEGHCRTCGYDLRATPDRCPECGTTPLIAGKDPA